MPRILCHPVFENECIVQELEQIGRTLGLGDIQARELIAVSLLNSRFRLRVRCEDWGDLSWLKLTKVRIVDEKRTYVYLLNDIEAKIDGQNEIELGEFETIFPSHGLYWLELEMKDEMEDSQVEIETQQLMLNGIIERGWSDKSRRNFLRQPIIVLNVAEVYQAKLNRKMVTLSKWMLGFTILMAILTALMIVLTLAVYHKTTILNF